MFKFRLLNLNFEFELQRWRAETEPRSTGL